MKSLRGYLSFWLVLGFVAMATCSSLAIYWWVQGALVDEFDHTSLSRARAISAFLDYEDGVVDIEYDPSSLPEYADVEGANFFEIYVPSEKKLGRSPSLRGKPSIFGKGHAAAIEGSHRAQELTMPDGRPGRSLVLRVELLPDLEDDDEVQEGFPNPENPGKVMAMPRGVNGSGVESGTEKTVGTASDSEVLASVDLDSVTAFVTVARSSEHLDDQLHTLRWSLIIGTLLLGLCGYLAIHFIVGSGLSQLVLLGQRAAKVDVGSLSDRMPEGGLHREVQSLSTTLNELLSRVESGFDRERRMTANLAHELRTPISELRTASDVAERWPHDDDLGDNLRRVAGESARLMHRIVDGLLHMARIESGDIKLENAPIEMSDLIAETWLAQSQLAESRQLQVEIQAESGVVYSDAALLRIVVSNLINNALSHSDEGGVINSSLTSVDGCMRWRVTNHSRGLSEEDLRQLSEPFWCRDGSRANSEHVGLGLALADRTASLLSAELIYRLEGRQFVAELSISK